MGREISDVEGRRERQRPTSTHDRHGEKGGEMESRCAPDMLLPQPALLFVHILQRDAANVQLLFAHLLLEHIEVRRDVCLLHLPPQLLGALPPQNCAGGRCGVGWQA